MWIGLGARLMLRRRGLRRSGKERNGRDHRRIGGGGGEWKRVTGRMTVSSAGPFFARAWWWFLLSFCSWSFLSFLSLWKHLHASMALGKGGNRPFILSLFWTFPSFLVRFSIAWGFSLTYIPFFLVSSHWRFIVAFELHIPGKQKGWFSHLSWMTGAGGFKWESSSRELIHHFPRMHAC